MRGWAETGAGRVMRVVPDGDMGLFLGECKRVLPGNLYFV